MALAKGEVLFDEEELIKNAQKPDGFLLKNVPEYAQTSDLFTPCTLPKPTQKSVACYIEKEQSFEDQFFGVSNMAYGGVGSRDYKYQFVPKAAHHLRTAVDEAIPTNVAEHNRKYLIQNHTEHFASPIKEVGFQLHHAMREYAVDKSNLHKVKKNLFPRSVVFEPEYTKNNYRKVMLAALERERMLFEEKKNQKKNNRVAQEQADAQQKQAAVPNKNSLCTKDLPNLEKDISVPEPPFWWAEKDSQRVRKAPYEGLDDFTTPSMNKPLEEKNFMKDMDLDNPEGYQPGEIYKGKLKISNVETKQTDKTWKPRDPNFETPFEPSTIIMECPLFKDVIFRLNMSPNEMFTKEEMTPNKKQIKEHVGCCHYCKQKMDEYQRMEDLRLGAITTSTPLRPYVPRKENDDFEVPISRKGCVSTCNLRGCTHHRENEKPPQRPECEREALQKLDEGVDMAKQVFGVDLRERPCFPFPGEGVKYLPYGYERQDEMFKVGFPFGTEASRWMECNIDPLALNTQKKSKFPWSNIYTNIPL